MSRTRISCVIDEESAGEYTEILLSHGASNITISKLPDITPEGAATLQHATDQVIKQVRPLLGKLGAKRSTRGPYALKDRRTWHMKGTRGRPSFLSICASFIQQENLKAGDTILIKAFKRYVIEKGYKAGKAFAVLKAGVGHSLDYNEERKAWMVR